MLFPAAVDYESNGDADLRAGKELKAYNPCRSTYLDTLEDFKNTDAQQDVFIGQNYFSTQSCKYFSVGVRISGENVESRFRGRCQTPLDTDWREPPSYLKTSSNQSCLNASSTKSSSDDRESAWIRTVKLVENSLQITLVRRVTM